MRTSRGCCMGACAPRVPPVGAAWVPVLHVYSRGRCTGASAPVGAAGMLVLPRASRGCLCSRRCCTGARAPCMLPQAPHGCSRSRGHCTGAGAPVGIAQQLGVCRCWILRDLDFLPGAAGERRPGLASEFYKTSPFQQISSEKLIIFPRAKHIIAISRCSRCSGTGSHSLAGFGGRSRLHYPENLPGGCGLAAARLCTYPIRARGSLPLRFPGAVYPPGRAGM